MAKIGLLSENFYWYDGETFQSGGGENYEFSLVQNMVKQGHDVQVYQFSFKPFTKKYMNNWGSMTVKGLGNMNPNGEPVGSVAAERGVDMFLNATKDCDMHILLTVNLAYKTMPKPTVSIFHGIYWNFESPTYKQPEWNENYLKRWIRNVPFVVSVDTDCINFVRANFPRYINGLYYIPNYVDVNIFKPKPRKEDGMFKVLYARRLNTLRGLELYIQAAEILTKKYEDIKFTICGKGLGDTHEHVNKWCRDHRNCEYTSHDLSEMQNEYPNHDINVVPSIASEGLSLSMLEGMACGLPCIGTDVGGIPNALINNYNGLLIKANELDTLVNAIEYAYLNREKVKEWGKNAQAIAQTFNKDRWNEQWNVMIDKVLSFSK